jgi:hypothetical protein
MQSQNGRNANPVIATTAGQAHGTDAAWRGVPNFLDKFLPAAASSGNADDDDATAAAADEERDYQSALDADIIGFYYGEDSTKAAAALEHFAQRRQQDARERLQHAKDNGDDAADDEDDADDDETLADSFLRHTPNGVLFQAPGIMFRDTDVARLSNVSACHAEAAVSATSDDDNDVDMTTRRSSGSESKSNSGTVPAAAAAAAAADPIDSEEVFDMLRHVNDPEHPLTYVPASSFFACMFFDCLFFPPPRGSLTVLTNTNAQ